MLLSDLIWYPWGSRFLLAKYVPGFPAKTPKRTQKRRLEANWQKLKMVGKCMTMNVLQMVRKLILAKAIYVHNFKRPHDDVAKQLNYWPTTLT